MKTVRQIRPDTSGVASTVGTIMALLVFLTFMSLIVNQYVPVWMKDSEAAHMAGAFGQFGSFKGDIELQMLAAQVAQNAGRHYIPITKFSPVSLGLDGVPIFSSPTIGNLDSFPERGTFTTQFWYSIQGVPTWVNESSSGRIVLDVFNRYYIHQVIVYENGGVIRWQDDGQAMRAFPTFEVDVVNGTVQIAWTQVSLFGTGSASGTTTEGVHSKVLGVDFQEYSRVTSDMYVNTTTPYGLAWVAFFNKTLGDAFGIDSGAFKNCPSYCFSQSYLGVRTQIVSISTPYYKLYAQWKDPKQAYDVNVQIYNDPNNSKPFVMPITKLWIQHGFVNIAVADKGAEVSI